MNLLTPLLPLWLSLGLAVAVFASEPIPVQAFYGKQPGQVFQEKDRQELQLGYAESQPDQPILTWEGRVGLKALYVEVQRDHLRLVHDQGTRVLWFRDAMVLHREPSRGLDVNNAGLYVTPGHGDRPGLLCIEAFEEGMHRSTPDQEVYVVLDPLGRATLYKLPRHQAMATGIVRTGLRSYAVPQFQEQPRGTGKVAIQYHRLICTGYLPQGLPIAARYAQGDAFRLELVAP